MSQVATLLDTRSPFGTYPAERMVRAAWRLADRHDLSCISVRLGSPRFDQSGDWNPEKPSHEISPRDTAQLFACCVDVEDLEWAVVPGISRHKKGWQDVEDACRALGYQPQDGTAFPRA